MSQMIRGKFTVGQLVRAARRIAVVACALWLFGGVTAAGAVDPLELYGIFSLTGPAAFAGASYKAAVQAVEERVNRTGGIRGRQIHFTVYDDQTNPSTSVQLANNIAAKNGVAIVGPALSGTCNAVAPTISKTNGPFMYCMSGTVQTEGNPFVYGGGSSFDFAKASLNFIQARGLNRVALLTSTDATGSDAEKFIRGMLATPEYSKLSLVANEHFNVTDISVGAQVSRAKAASAQVFFIWTTGTGLGTALRGMKDVGMDVPTITAPGNGNAALLRPLVTYMPKELYVSAYDGEAESKVTDRGVRAQLRQFRNDFAAIGITEPDPTSLTGWDFASLIIEGLKRVGPDANSAQLRDWVNAQTRYTGAIGIYDFHRVPHHGIDSTSVYITQWDPVKQAFIGISKAGGFL